MSDKKFNWRLFAKQQKMNLDEIFWEFFRYGFLCSAEERKIWKTKDKDYDKHIKQLRELINLASKEKIE